MTKPLCLLALTGLLACEVPAVTPHALAVAPSAQAMPSSVPVVPPPTPLARFRAEAAKTSQAYATLASLVDASGPRITGSPGYEAAVAWALRAMPAAGLTNVHTEKVMAKHWVRGAESASIVAPSPHALTLAALGGSVGTPKDGLEAEVLEVASLDALAKLTSAEVTGKIVYFDSHMERSRDGHGYGVAVPVRGSGASRAGKLGAVAVLIRSVGTDEDRFAHTGAMTYEAGAPKIPAAALSLADANVLHRLLSSGQKVRVRLSLGADTLPDVEVANVVGDLPGSAAPREVVLLGAHLDSWDLGHGAEDDGAGCAIMLEVARQLAKLPTRPRRTVRVVLFANEEMGLAGGEGYGKAHAAEAGDHVVAIEADFGSGRVDEVRFLGTPDARAKVGKLLEPVGFELAKKDAWGGADVSPMRKLGVPVLDLRQDGTRYFDVHHTANDTLEHVVKEELDDAAAAYAAVTLSIADGTESLGRAVEGKHD